jgi:hypothetical protein
VSVQGDHIDLWLEKWGHSLYVPVVWARVVELCLYRVCIGKVNKDHFYIMKQSHFRESDSLSVSQDISTCLWNLK